MNKLEEIEHSISDYLKWGTLIFIGLIMSYQVGYYQELGFQFFTILSLQDHIMIFLKLTPMILLIQVFCFYAGISAGSEINIAKESSNKKERISAKRFDLFIYFCAIILLISSNSWLSALGWAATLLWFKYGLGMLSPILNYLDNKPVLIGAMHWIPGVFALVFTYGVNSGNKLLYSEIENPWLVCNESNNECINAEVISIFEHGIFFKTEDKINFKYSNSDILISSPKIPENHETPMQEIVGLFNIERLKDIFGSGRGT